MIAEKTITINGKEVRMRYCAAAETGYEKLSGKSAEIFVPIVKKRDEEGNPTEVEPPTATTKDYILLGLAAVIAAYAREGKEAPIEGADILYDATPDEVKTFILTVYDLRKMWYNIPGTVPASEFTESTEDEEKNAQQPANDSNGS